ncbi:hypothetical protein [Paenibacillus lignilyticus]|uniref:5-bromo-4-chloroindolyl phosphate hydrolysis protein n=1 Tax=Paenibacillus lignilyticus TaxID=1172615 RepID=A0ABS5CK25_9BACL|nr:hypothetical protein [Paenibacillus lignilyticus]MBP3966227.1 hypothetical protein [Paenibacillus lignilyticus]
MGTKFVKLLGMIVVIAALNIAVFSPGLMGIEIGERPFESALGVTLLLASGLTLLYGSFTLLFKQQESISPKQLQTREDFEEALMRYRRVKVLQEDMAYALEQMERMNKRQDTLLNVLGQRFDPNELSYKKFASVTREVEKLFYLNVRSILNRLHVFDESELENAGGGRKPSRISPELLQVRSGIVNEQLTFVKQSLESNEEMLIKLDKLLLEISRLDSFEPSEIDQMPCMQEIDSLIKQTKYYKQ